MGRPPRAQVARGSWHTARDMVLSTAASTDHLSWIPKVLRPFGHLSIVDGIPALDVGTLAGKSLSLHTEMVFSRIVHGALPEAQGRTLESAREARDEQSRARHLRSHTEKYFASA